MKRLPITIQNTFLLLILLSTFTSATAAEKESDSALWKAGLSKAVITQEKSVWLAGYGSKRAPTGKIHDIWMKALALEDTDGKQVVLITSDFQGVPKSMSDPAFEQIEKKYGIKRTQIMLTFSHNHCGPRLGDDLIDYYPVDAEQEALVEEYTQEMIAKTVKLVGEALDNLKPAKLEKGEGRALFAVNRRNNREADVPMMLANGTPLAGPVDHSVPLLTVTRPDGKLAAILFGYACHPTTLNFTQICGDYPGFAQIEIEKNHPGALAMFVNTCGGDQNPLPRRKVELCEKYGHLLAVGVEEGLKEPMQTVPPGIKTAFEIVHLPYQKTMTRADLNEALKSGTGIKARWANRLLRKLDEGAEFEEAYPYPVHAWQLGDNLTIIGMGAETVVDYALRFKREFGPDSPGGNTTWVFGYADDMISYIPSRRVWEEGGYEGGSNLFEYGRPALRWAGDMEDRIAEVVHQLVKDVRKD